MGVAPVLGYHYGAENREELKSLRKKCLIIMLVFGIVLTGLAEALSRPLTAIFVRDNREVFDLTLDGMLHYSIAYLLMGFSVFGSAFFTALNNGLVSAGISFLRALVFQLGAVLILPIFWKITGVWLAVVFAEVLSTVVTFVSLAAMQKKIRILTRWARLCRIND